MSRSESGRPDGAGDDRRSAVLESALKTFARYGYRKTSMDQVATDAGISRPGLYFLFDSKESLFRAAVEQALQRDLAGVERALARTDRSLRANVVDAFDHWAGRYVGPSTRDVAGVIDENPTLLGPVAVAAPTRFAGLVTAALARTTARARAVRTAETLISTSIGIKHQVNDRREYLRRLRAAVALLVPDGATRSS